MEADSCITSITPQSAPSNYLLLVSSRETGFSQVMESVSWRLT